MILHERTSYVISVVISVLKRGSLFVNNTSLDFNRTATEVNRSALHLGEFISAKKYFEMFETQLFIDLADSYSKGP